MNNLILQCRYFRLVLIAAASLLFCGHGFAASASELDPTFDPGSGVSRLNGGPGQVQAIVVQPDGKIVIGGVFQRVNGTARNSIARLNPDGGLDDGFKANVGDASESVNALVLQPDGKLLVGGAFASIAGQSRQSIARLNADGTVDAGFKPPRLFAPLYPLVFTIALRDDGKIYVGGLFYEPGQYPPRPPFSLFRLNSDGSRDTTFTGSVNSHDLIAGYNSPGLVERLVVLGNGDVLAAGRFVMANATESTGASGTLAGGFARFDNVGNGAAFAPADFGVVPVPRGMFGAFIYMQSATVSCLAFQKDARILVGENSLIAPGAPARVPTVQRLTLSGAPDSSFQLVTLDTVTNAFGSPRAASALAIQPDGKIVIGGNFTNVNGQTRLGLARLENNGTLDSFMATGSISGGSVAALALQADGRILVGGTFTNVNGVSRWAIARLNPGSAGLRLVQPVLRDGTFSVSVLTSENKNYILQGSDSLARTNWTTHMTLKGNDAIQLLFHNSASGAQYFYRVQEE